MRLHFPAARVYHSAWLVLREGHVLSLGTAGSKLARSLAYIGRSCRLTCQVWPDVLTCPGSSAWHMVAFFNTASAPWCMMEACAMQAQAWQPWLRLLRWGPWAISPAACCSAQPPSRRAFPAPRPSCTSWLSSRYIVAWLVKSCTSTLRMCGSIWSTFLFSSQRGSIGKPSLTSDTALAGMRRHVTPRLRHFSSS